MSMLLWIIGLSIILVLIIIILYIMFPNATVVSGDAIPDITDMIPISFDGVYDAGYGGTGNSIDDGNIRLPIGIPFSFFGIDYGTSSSISWNSNNALIFGPFTNFNNSISISATTCSAILLGNYDRIMTSLSTKKTSTTTCDIITVLPTFTNYFTDNLSISYQMVIRLIKEKHNQRRQWVETTMISSPPSSGYSNDESVTYPSGKNTQGQNVDSNGNIIDSTKSSPYNITNGTLFLNPCGTLYTTSSPANQSTMLFQSDSTGTEWSFINHAHIGL
jgi:hypothetical protein